MYEVTVGKHGLKTTITVENKGNKFLIPRYSIRQGYIFVCVMQAPLAWVFIFTSLYVVKIFYPQRIAPASTQVNTWELI